MFGESGTSATGRTYYYYKCANVKRRKGCNKKTVQKDWLEDLVVRETMKLIQDEAVIDKIVQLVMDVQNQENTTIPLLEKQLREVNKKLDNLMKAIEDGLERSATGSRRIARAVWPRCGPKTGTPARPASQRCDGIGTPATPRPCAGGSRSRNWGTR